MIDKKSDIVRKALEIGTGAEVSLKADRSGVQTSLQIWFTDLTRRGGPVLTLGPSGLHRHRVIVQYGRASTDVINQIYEADDGARRLACALTASIDPLVKVTFPSGMNRQNWTIAGQGFCLSAERKGIVDPLHSDEINETCQDVVVPLMAALAELIGYDEVVLDLPGDEHGNLEGSMSLNVVRRRERNPRNRLLAIRLHGHKCKICGVDPRDIYGELGQVLEVHHLIPLATIEVPRVYNPASDLIPLCPTCHRVVHTRSPIPWEPHEIVDRSTSVPN